MVNRAGKNGTNNGEHEWQQVALPPGLKTLTFIHAEPPDDVLEESLLRYARLRLSVAAKLANLASEHNYHIRCVFFLPFEF